MTNSGGEDEQPDPSREGAGYPPRDEPQQYDAPYATPPRYGPDHPQATTVLVLGILGLVVCGALAPFAWVIGGRVLREIDASHGYLGGRAAAQVGWVLGIIGTVLLGLALLFLVVLVGLFGLLSLTTVTSTF